MPSSTTRKQPADRKPARKTTTSRKAPRQETSQPIPQPDADPTGKYAPNAWLSGGVGGLEDLTVPSGQVCLVRRPGMQGLIKAGVLHNVDSLSQIVNEKHLLRVDGKATDEINMSSLLNDEQGMDEVLHVMDKVICHVVVKPEVHMTPGDVTRRQPGVVYADMVDLVDKMAIFNYAVGGTRDMESFREGLSDVVGGLEAVEGVHDEA
jgi:hypothetical protein